MPRRKKPAALTATKKPTPGAADKSGLPPASSEALAIDQAAAVSHAEISGTAQPGPEGPAPDLGPELGKRDQVRAAELTAQEIKTVQAKGTAQLLMLLGTKIAGRRWPGVTFDQDEMHQGVDVLAPVLIKYDLGSALFDRYKEEFAAGAFFAGLITAKVQLYEAAQLQREQDKKKEPAPGEAAHGG